jgi:hypothetical protein
MLYGIKPIDFISTCMGQVPLLSCTYVWDQSHVSPVHRYGTDPIYDMLIPMGPVPYLAQAYAWDQSHI